MRNAQCNEENFDFGRSPAGRKPNLFTVISRERYYVYTIFILGGKHNEENRLPADGSADAAGHCRPRRGGVTRRAEHARVPHP